VAKTPSNVKIIDPDADAKAGQERELARQKDQREAVAKANKSELPKLGGTPHNPGNPGDLGE
jgi:hypothetical protein